MTAERHDDGELVNVGAEHEISIGEAVALIPGLIGFAGRIVCDTSEFSWRRRGSVRAGVDLRGLQRAVGRAPFRTW